MLFVAELALLVAGLFPATAEAAFHGSAGSSAGYSSATVSPPSGMSVTTSCGHTLLDPSTLTVTWTATASSFATGYSVVLSAAGVPLVPITVSGRGTTTVTVPIVRGVSYTLTVRATVGQWTSVQLSGGAAVQCPVI